jgi:hypothetical protein
MKIYTDSSLKEETKTLDFGIVLAGDTKKITYCLYNETDAEVVELQAIVSNAEVKVLDCPKSLKSKETSSATFEWSPAINVKRGLKTELNLKFFELYS